MFETYDDFLAQRVDSLGEGKWELVSDTSHMSHRISSCTINQVLAPALVVPDPGFRRGDAVDLSDAVCALAWQFSGEAVPGCLAALNTNGDSVVDLSDSVYLLGFLFSGGLPPVTPFPACGPQTLDADEDLGCETTPQVCK